MPSLAGTFLIANPRLRAANFRQTVVLVLQHRPQGAFGLVLNRPAPDPKGLPFPVFDGGPARAQGLLLLHGHPEWATASTGPAAKAVAPGIFVGDFSCLKRVSEAAAVEGLRFRAFTGYACWGPGQLEREISMGSWTTLPASAELLFETPVEDLWNHLAPSRVPQPSTN
jgi:putative transcriptional regulator